MEPIIIEELARMLEDVAQERGRREGEEIGRRAGEEIGRRAGEENGRREGEEIGRRQAIVDLAEAYGIPLDEPRRAWIASASLVDLERVRVALERDRAWPALPRVVGPRRKAPRKAAGVVPVTSCAAVAPSFGGASRQRSERRKRLVFPGDHAR